MLYQVSHQISYAYTAEVFLEPHTVRMRPRSDVCQQLREFSMAVEPRPAGQHDFLDAEGNLATCIWFEEKISSLTISTSLDVQTSCPNPFGYLVTDHSFLQLPVTYREDHALSLGPYLNKEDPVDAVTAYCKAIIDESQGNTLEFLNRLCSAIYRDFKVELRHMGAPMPPAQSLQVRKGACRDLAVLFIAVCRTAGLAARFVSGYQEGIEGMEHPHLHAWAEVYIPGGGWRGYDPTHGLAVTDRHIILAAGHDPARAAAVKGSFRGTGVTAEMDYRIALTTVSG